MPWYKTGTATVTLSSATVTGAGTAWVDNTRIGDAFIGPDGLVYEITARASDTSLTIAPPYKSATGSARPYVIAPMQGYVKTLADQAQLLLNSTEPIVSAGTTAQYYRGDKTWQTLSSTAVGLGSVNNTSDANKPVSTAQAAALALKAPLASPALTGTPTAPTAAVGTSSTQIATTALVKATGDLKLPLAGGTLTGSVLGRPSTGTSVPAFTALAHPTSFSSMWTSRGAPFRAAAASLGNLYAAGTVYEYNHQPLGGGGSYSGVYSAGVVNDNAASPGAFAIHHINADGASSFVWRFQGGNGTTQLPGDLLVTGATRCGTTYTTGIGANAYIAADEGGLIYRSTSSLRYKRDVENLDDALVNHLYEYRPVWFRSKGGRDNPDWSWYGLIAEEVAEIEPRLVHWGYPPEDYLDGDGKVLREGAQKVPDGVQYDRFVVPLIACVQKQKGMIDALEARLSKLEKA